MYNFNDVRKNENKGFSLVELIVVIAIMAVMTSVLAPALLQYVERSRAQKDDSAMGEVTNAIMLALSDQDIYDEVLFYARTNNNSCYVDVEKPTAEKVVIKGKADAPEVYEYDDDSHRNLMRDKDKMLSFRVNRQELDRINAKREEIGVQNMGAYLRKMAMDGYCVNLEMSDVKELVRLLRICSNNLNQYAKKANETGSIYIEDIRELQVRLDEIWTNTKEILSRLAMIQ